MMMPAGNVSFGKVFLLKMTMGGSFWPLAWQLRTTVKDDFSFPVVRIDTVLVRFLHSVVHGDIKGEGNLVHVGDVLWPDLLFSDLVFAVHTENDQLFFVVWQLLRDGSLCADREITSFHKTKASRRTASKVIDIQVQC